MIGRKKYDPLIQLYFEEIKAGFGKADSEIKQVLKDLRVNGYSHGNLVTFIRKEDRFGAYPMSSEKVKKIFKNLISLLEGINSKMLKHHDKKFNICFL